MIKDEIKKKLLQLNLVNDCEYLDLYLQLVCDEKNVLLKRELGKTQRHHIIPKSYYKHNKLTIDNSKDNVIYLLYKDHCLAHYYLCLCAKEKWFIESSQHCFGNMVKEFLQLSHDEIIELFPQYETIYYNFCLKQSKLASKRHTTLGKISIYNETTNKKKYIEKDKLNEYISNGWVVGGIPHTEREKMLIGKNSKKCLTGRHLSEGVKLKQRLTMIELYNDKQSSYYLSRKELGKKLRGKKRPKSISDKIVKIRKEKNGGEYCSSETRLKMSKALKGKTCAIKGKKCIHKDNIEKFVFPDEIKTYLELGWKLGKNVK